MNRFWYKERYIVRQLNGEPIYSWRIKEVGTERIVAKELNGIDADLILENVNKRDRLYAN